MAAVVRNGLIRPGPDATYADGDDSTWMDVDWPSLQRPVELLGLRVNTLDTQRTSSAGTGTQRTSSAGTGTQRLAGAREPAPGAGLAPLLFLHGWSSNWQIFLLNIAAFMRERRCLALDMPGFGCSEMPAEPISIKGYAKTVDAMCDALGVESVVVVGNSMGGFVGAELGLSFDTRVERLVLVSAAGLSTEHVNRSRALVAARALASALPHVTRLESPVVRRPRLRRAAMQWVLRYPEKLSIPLAEELVLSFGKPGFVAGLQAIMDYS